jgi:hypothetical protein
VVVSVTVATETDSEALLLLLLAMDSLTGLPDALEVADELVVPVPMKSVVEDDVTDEMEEPGPMRLVVDMVIVLRDCVMTLVTVAVLVEAGSVTLLELTGDAGELLASVDSKGVVDK